MTTMHSIMRARERAGMNSKEAEHFIRNAIERGKTSEAFSRPREREWLAERCQAGFSASVYNGYCFIISGEKCITLYEVPGWFDRNTMYDGSSRVRNKARYCRFNPVYTDEAG